jgi:hypothetical protein
MLTVNPAELHGLLTDVLRTAGPDVTMPMLNGLLLHVETEGDSTVLVGSSTDRFRFGQAHVPATGEIPATFVKASSVKQLLTALQPYGKTHDLLCEVTVTERVKLTLRLPGDMVLPAVTITVHVEGDKDFPKVAKIAEMAPTEGAGPVAFNGSMLSAFVAIAKRRGEYLRFDVSHAVAKPSLIYIGERYRGLLMPLRPEQASKPIASMYIPPREKPTTDEPAAA